MKKPRFKARVGWARRVLSSVVVYASRNGDEDRIRVRVTDAREITAKEAVRRVLQEVYDTVTMFLDDDVERCAKKAGFSTIVRRRRVIVKDKP